MWHLLLLPLAVVLWVMPQALPAPGLLLGVFLLGTEGEAMLLLLLLLPLLPAGCRPALGCLG